MSRSNMRASTRLMAPTQLKQSKRYKVLSSLQWSRSVGQVSGRISCKSLDLTFRSSSDGHETPLRDEDTLIRRRHAKPALSVGDQSQAPEPPSGPPQAAGLRSVFHGRTTNAAVRSSTRRTVSVKSSPDVYTHLGRTSGGTS